MILRALVVSFLRTWCGVRDQIPESKIRDCLSLSLSHTPICSHALLEMVRRGRGGEKGREGRGEGKGREFGRRI